MSTVENLVLKDQVMNRELPETPFSVNLQGKHGQVVELDPRRVRPLDYNPREDDNPGFSETSIEVLSEGIRVLQQQEDAKVVPIVGDPDYDAQLYDGERRLRSCLRAGLTFVAKVREDISPEDENALFLAAVACNSEKEPHTTTELVKIVSRMREMGLKHKEIGHYIGRSEVQVSQYFQASLLNPEVVKLLAEGLSLATALRLKIFPPEKQLAHALKIVNEEMGVIKARRYIINAQRQEGHRSPVRKGRHKQLFESLQRLTETSGDKFGVYLDMHGDEITAMIRNVSADDKAHVASDLRFLSSCLKDIADLIKPEKRDR